MRHLLSDEQVMFADAIDRFVAQEHANVSVTAPRAVDRARFARFAEMGGLSLAISPDQGGIGGAVETMVVIERLAPALTPDPVLSSGVHAAALLAAASASQGEALIAGMAAGERIFAIAHLEPGMRRAAPVPETVAQRSGDGFVLNGRKALVTSGAEADTLLVSAHIGESGALAWFVIDGDAAGITRRPAPRIDGMPAADVDIQDCRVPASALLDLDDPVAALAAADDLAEAAQIAEMVGLMDALVKATTDYVATRRQFGVAIGTFQALRHRIADMWMECEEARALAYAAALACSGTAQERAEAVSIAKVRACDAADKVGAEAIQIHGGIGMTDELIVSHWYRRLWALKLSIGDRRWHLARLADRSRDFALA